MGKDKNRIFKLSRLNFVYSVAKLEKKFFKKVKNGLILVTFISKRIISDKFKNSPRNNALRILKRPTKAAGNENIHYLLVLAMSKLNFY